MSTLSAPTRGTNNVNGRSRSPSPSSPNVIVHTNGQPTTNIRTNLLSPDNSNLLRERRSTSQDAVHETIPLIDAESFKPPLANPEIDDLPDDRDVVNAPYPGIDDGFFSNRLNPDGPDVIDNNGGNNIQPSIDDLDSKRGLPGRRTLYPLSPTDNRPFPDFELGLASDLDSIPDINVYQHKKTLAQGMMDLALFSANANQLRYVLESYMHPYYYSGIALISISLIFQVLIGVGLIWNARYNVKDEKQICIANRISNFTIIGIFLVTVVNVFISAFGVASVQPVVGAVASPQQLPAASQPIPVIANP